MKQRLIFGTSGLAGFTSHKASERILRLVVESGVKHIDTAPMYGLGLAEEVIGRVIGQQQEVKITTKVGFPPPKLPKVKAIVRSLRRAAYPRQTSKTNDVELLEFTDPRLPRGCFEIDFIHESIRASKRRLKRDDLDAILLHEAYCSSLRTVDWESIVNTDIGAYETQLGIANGAQYDVSMRRWVPRGYLVQAAFPCVSFQTNISDGADRYHSILKSFFYFIKQSEKNRVAVDQTLSRYRQFFDDESSNAFLLSFLIAMARYPNSKFIFHSTNYSRLRTFLSKIDSVDAHLTKTVLDTFSAHLK